MLSIHYLFEAAKKPKEQDKELPNDKDVRTFRKVMKWGLVGAAAAQGLKMAHDHYSNK